MKRKIRKRRYDDGGSIGEPDPVDVQVPDVEADYDSLPFSKAFGLARKMGEKVFTWHGKKYGTNLALPDVNVSVPREDAPSGAPSAADYKASGRAGLSTRSHMIRPDVKDLDPNDKRAMRNVVDLGITGASMLGTPAVAGGARALAAARAARGTSGFLGDGALGQLKSLPAVVRNASAASRAARAAEDAKWAARSGKWTDEYGLGLKKGGTVKRFSAGGTVSRGDGCAVKGKTKGKVR
jgi:hypothetical protein